MSTAVELASHDAIGEGRDPVRLGVVGGGLVAQLVHLPTLQRLAPAFSVVAIADPSAEVRESVARRHGIAATFADHRAMLDAQTCEALLVCAPNGAHAAVTLDALDAGCHVLVEKPLCITLADADRIIARRDATGLVVQVGYMKRFDPAWEALCDDLDETGGQLLHLGSQTCDPGLPRYFGAIIAGRVPRGTVLALERATSDQVGAAVGSDAPADVSSFSNAFLGALIHDVNLGHGILERLGMRTPGTPLDAAAMPAGQMAFGVVELAGGVRWTMAWLLIPGLGEFREQIAIHAVDSVRALSFPAPYVSHGPATFRRLRGAGHAAETVSARSYRDAYAAELEHFHRCITEHRPCRTPPEQARDDIAMLTALYRLQRTRGGDHRTPSPATRALL